jgi:hypothetical protein
MAKEHYKNPKLTHFKALQMYLDLVREIPDVVEVRLAEHDELHTIISAPTHESDHRHRIIDAQVEIMRGIEDQPFLFHLLNYNEMSPASRDKDISRMGELVWKR